MEENLMDFLFDVAMVALFIAALTVFFIIYPLGEKNMSLLKDGLNREPALMTGSRVEEYAVSGAEIIGSIYLGLERDIEVRDSEADIYPLKVRATDTRKENFDRSDMDYYSKIDQDGKYKAAGVFDTSGVITGVKYTLIP